MTLHRPLLTVLRNLMRPGYAPVMLGKLRRRLLDAARAGATPDWSAWTRVNAADDAAFAAGLDAELWDEAQRFGSHLRRRADRVVGSLPVRLGGGAHYELLYFLTRLLRPEVIVETGVAAGFSSCAFLGAMALNGRGRLYSTDFPYFRLANPERYIGCLVEPEARERWILHTRGDLDGLARIVREVSRIDLFHYDSDKCYAGRAAALSVVASRLADESLIVMDDIGEDGFFHDYVEERAMPWTVLAFRGRHLGVMGPLVDRSRAAEAGPAPAARRGGGRLGTPLG